MGCTATREIGHGNRLDRRRIAREPGEEFCRRIEVSVLRAESEEEMIESRERARSQHVVVELIAEHSFKDVDLFGAVGPGVGRGVVGRGTGGVGGRMRAGH